ncbi:MAG TPA: PH domain-containing protein, partial [Alphaproteobacteria bacterium]
MSYVKEVLQSGERVLYQARISLWNFFVLYVAIVVLLLAMIGANNAGSTMGIVYILLVIAYFVIRILITYYGTELVLTDSRLIYKRGFISRYTSEMTYKKIESIHVAQSILGRLLNYG